MTDTGIEPVDEITTRPLDQPKDNLGQCQEKPNNWILFQKIFWGSLLLGRIRT